MKLQIISRLHQARPQPSHSKKHPKHEQQTSPSTNILVKNLQEYISNANHEKRHKKSKDNFAFFNNFEDHCSVKYQSSSFHQHSVKRKLEAKLGEMAASSNSDNLIKGFALSQETMKFEAPPLASTEPQMNLNDYYFIHQKSKPKVRKFNSLITIRTQPSGHDQPRKPGFILKRNMSLVKKESGIFESNKQNINTVNVSGLKRVESKERLDLVDEQISQSKERIAKIRKELNEIYQSKKGTNSYRLKIY